MNGLEAILDAMVTSPKLEIQDWWLSEPGVPSMAGAERDNNVGRTIGVCVELDLLADRTFTVTGQGELLKSIAQGLGMFDGQNPFKSYPQYSFAAYMQILRSDWAFVGTLLREVPDREFAFREDILPLTTRILDSVATTTPRTAANRSAHAWLQRQIESSRKLEARLAKEGVVAGANTKTLLRPIEDLLLPRLEFMVDVGILYKPEPARFNYRRGTAFNAYADLSRGPVDGLDSRYFDVVGAAATRRRQRLADPIEIAAHLSPSAARLRGITGYSLINETAIAANMETWASDPWVYIELNDAREALRQLATSDPPKARIVSDRFGRPHTFKLVE